LRPWSGWQSSIGGQRSRAAGHGLPSQASPSSPRHRLSKHWSEAAAILDRLSRSQADIAALYERLQFLGVRIETLADGPVSEIHVGLKGNRQRFLKDPATGKRLSRENPEREWHRQSAPSCASSMTARGSWCSAGAPSAAARTSISSGARNGRCPDSDAYQKARKRVAEERRRSRHKLEATATEVERKIARLLTLVENGHADPIATGPRINELVAERRRLAAELNQQPTSNVVEFFPRAAEQLPAEGCRHSCRAEPGETGDREAIALVRSLIGRIVVHATPAPEPLGLEVEGSLAALMTDAPELEHSGISCSRPPQPSMSDSLAMRVPASPQQVLVGGGPSTERLSFFGGYSSRNARCI
jgi:hypothetical protein